MRKTMWVVISILVISGLLFGIFGCTTTTPTPTPTTTPTSSPTTTPTPSSSPTQPQVIKWKGQTSYFTSPPPISGMPYKTGMGTYGEDWAQWIKEISKDEVAPPESIVASKDALNAVGQGAIDFWATGFSAGYSTGIIPEANFALGVPWGWPTIADMYDWLYSRGAEKLLQQAYNEKNIYYFPAPCYDVYAIHSTVPINRVADLKGLKIRITGTNAELAKQFGASPTVIPPAEAYMALKMGTIDAAHWGVSVLDTQKTKEVIKYLLVKPVSCGAMLDFEVNMDKWKALPDDLKKIIAENTKYRELATAAIAEEYANYIVSNAVRDYGIKLITWPDEDYKLIMEKAVPIVVQLGTTSPRCKQLADLLVQQQKDLGRIK